VREKIGIIFRVITPFIFGGGLIFFLTRFTNLGEVGQLLAKFPTKINLLIFFSLALYFSFKFLTLSLLVKTAKLPLTFPMVAAAFAGGELARELPIAVIFPALAIWKKAKLGGVRIVAVPFLQVALELSAALFFLALFGLGDLTIFHWIGIGGILAILVFLLFIENFLKIVSLVPFAKKISLEFLTGLKNLIDFKILARFFLLALTYQFFLALIFYQIILAIGIENVSLPQAVSVFGANFVAAVISPLPFDLGVTESTGFLILTHMGATPESALSAMFAQRAIVVLSSWFLFGAICGLVFGEIRKFVFEKEGLT